MREFNHPLWKRSTLGPYVVQCWASDAGKEEYIGSWWKRLAYSCVGPSYGFVSSPPFLPSARLQPVLSTYVKKQPSQDVLHGDKAEEELGLARLVSSYTLPHQNSQPGKRGWQTAHSKVLSRCTRDTWSSHVTHLQAVLVSGLIR